MSQKERELYMQATNARNVLYMVIGALSANKHQKGMVESMALYESADGLSEALEAYVTKPEASDGSESQIKADDDY